MTKQTNTKRSLSQEVLEGLQETLEMLKGNRVDGAVSFAYNGHFINVKEIRTKLNMTCEEFAEAFHFKTKTVQNWEQGVRTPNGHTLAYLTLIAENPKKVYQTLHR